jgi:hypothetical protein
MTNYKNTNQFSDLIEGLNATQIKALKASKMQQERLCFLIEKSKNTTLNTLEKEELEGYVSLERFIRLAKIRAKDLSV